MLQRWRRQLNEEPGRFSERDDWGRSLAKEGARRSTERPLLLHGGGSAGVCFPSQLAAVQSLLLSSQVRPVCACKEQ
ncbi:hypothetical protein MRX96_049626 [Rhipicephalus microplus]